MGPIPGMDSLSDNVKIFMQREAAVKAANERHQKFMLGSPDPRVRALADPNLTPEQRAALPAPDYFAPISKEEQARVDAYIKETEAASGKVAVPGTSTAPAKPAASSATPRKSNKPAIAKTPTYNRPAPKANTKPAATTQPSARPKAPTPASVPATLRTPAAAKQQQQPQTAKAGYWPAPVKAPINFVPVTAPAKTAAQRRIELAQKYPRVTARAVPAPVYNTDRERMLAKELEAFRSKLQQKTYEEFAQKRLDEKVSNTKKKGRINGMAKKYPRVTTEAVPTPKYKTVNERRIAEAKEAGRLRLIKDNKDIRKEKAKIAAINKKRDTKK